MSKERLKEIQERVLVDKVYYKYLDGTKGHWGKTYTLNEEDYKYLIKQTERVQELEDENDILRQSINDVSGAAGFMLKKSEQQNKCYREAIEKSIEDLEEEIDIVDCARNAHYRLIKALEESE